MKTLDYVALVLMIIGGLLWGFIALFGYNPLGGLSTVPVVMQIIYALVGLSAIYIIASALVKLEHCTYYPVEGTPITTRV